MIYRSESSPPLGALYPVDDRIARHVAYEAWVRGYLPFEGDLVQLRVIDHIGTYTLPFPCELRAGVWVNATTRQPIEVPVVAWRTWRQSASQRLPEAGMPGGGLPECSPRSAEMKFATLP